MIDNISLFIVAFIISFALIILLHGLAVRFKLLNTDRRIAYIGGPGLALGFIICYLSFSFIAAVRMPFQIRWILLFSFIFLAVEFADDIKDFALKPKLLIQIALISLFLIYAKRMQIYFLPGWLNYTLSFLWLAGITNAFNHLDVGDGLCGGVSFIVAISFFAVFVKTGEILLTGLFAALSGALLAFLLFNFPPAKVFMGNSGSHFLGFLFAAISMHGDYAGMDNKLALFLPVFILAAPIIDTAYLIIARLKKNILPLKKSDDHIFLRYLSGGCRYRTALSNIYVLTLFWCLSGLFILRGLNGWFFVFAAAALVETGFILSRARISRR